MAGHPPKTELFDVAAYTNTDPKGFVRRVDQYREEGGGLYMARPADHPRFSYLESWLLPAHGIRVSIYHPTPGNQGTYRYIDVGRFLNSHDGLWRAEDWYLDIVEHPGQLTPEILDIDEILLAHKEHDLTEAESIEAIEITLRTVAGMAAHGGSVDAWLAEQGTHLTWR